MEDARPLTLISDDEPDWQWPSGGPSPASVYWWKDQLKEEASGRPAGTAMLWAQGDGKGLRCEGWLHITLDDLKGRIFVHGQLERRDDTDATRGKVGNGALALRGGTDSYDGHEGSVTVEVRNPKRYIITTTPG